MRWTRKLSKARCDISSRLSKRLVNDPTVLPNSQRYVILQEKQAENIVEKLCQRFRLSEDARQWRDIAFCLSLLPFKSERSVKKLIEGLQFYRDKLHEETVFNRFAEILAKVYFSLHIKGCRLIRHGRLAQTSPLTSQTLS
jgi:condensin complex subunit 1